MKQIAETVITAALLVGVALPSTAWSDSTRLLDLQERLNSQSNAFDQQMQRMHDLTQSQAAVNEWYRKARELPAGSVDFQHAEAKFVNARASLLRDQVVAVKGLKDINGRLEGTVAGLIGALQEQAQQRAGEDLNRLSGATFKRAVRQLQGTERLMNSLQAQGVVRKHPELAAVHAAFRAQARRIIARSKGSRIDQVGYLRELQAVIEAQGVLMDVVLADLHQKYLGLQALQVSGTTRLVGDRLQVVLKKTVQYFSQDGEDRDWNMIDQMQQKNAAGWSQSSAPSDQSLNDQLDALYEQGGGDDRQAR
jgi:hypothetical protein